MIGMATLTKLKKTLNQDGVLDIYTFVKFHRGHHSTQQYDIKHNDTQNDKEM